jgi:hypothetical protein
MIDHFHVHVVHIEHEGLAGMTVGQAHLLDDLISLVSPPLSPHLIPSDPTARVVCSCPATVNHRPDDLDLRPRCRTRTLRRSGK